MVVLFSAPFMQVFMGAWNSDAELAREAAGSGFNAVIGYGLEDDAQAAGVLTVREGKVMSAGAYAGETLDLDLRATPEAWQKWLARPLDPIAVGTALASRQIVNRRGDLAAVTGDAARARVFMRSFIVLAGVAGSDFTLPGAAESA